jgi:hypothetical protein
VRTALRIAALIGVVLTTSCGTPEHNAWLTGIPESDVMEISRLVRARTSEQILSYQRMPDGDVQVEVRSHDQYPNIYVVERVKGKWQISTNKVVVF